MYDSESDIHGARQEDLRIKTRPKNISDNAFLPYERFEKGGEAVL
jgi:hypothetical protein